MSHHMSSLSSLARPPPPALHAAALPAAAPATVPDSAPALHASAKGALMILLKTSGSSKGCALSRRAMRSNSKSESESKGRMQA